MAKKIMTFLVFCLLFVYDAFAQTLPPPTLLAPGTCIGQEISATTPAFFWTNVPGAVCYGLYISRYPYGEANAVYQNESLTGTYFKLPDGYLVNGEKYRWNMRTYDGAKWSNYSDKLYFNICLGSSLPVGTDSQITIIPPPVLISPPDGCAIPSSTCIVFKWNSVPGAIYYGLYIRDISSGRPIYDNDGPIYGTSLTLPAGTLEKDKNYIWNMRSNNGTQWGGFSPRLRFTIEGSMRTEESPEAVRKTESLYNLQDKKQVGIRTPEEAVAWAEARIGSDKYLEKDGTTYCLRFVRNAYNAGGLYGKDASEAYCLISHPNDRNIPVGALVFYEFKPNGKDNWGHVGIYIGNGKVISVIREVRETPLTIHYRATGEVLPYRGWGFFPGTPGRPASFSNTRSEVSDSNNKKYQSSSNSKPSQPSSTKSPLNDLLQLLFDKLLKK